MKIGQKLEAIDTCTMYDTEEDALIIGKIYKVVDVTLNKFYIKSEIDERHSFDKVELSQFFKPIN